MPTSVLLAAARSFRTKPNPKASATGAVPLLARYLLYSNSSPQLACDPRTPLLNRFKPSIVQYPAARPQAVSSAQSAHSSTLFPHPCPSVQLKLSLRDGIFSHTHCN